MSSVIVVGGCGDYFDVHDTAILVDNYVASDATERAHSVSDSFRTRATVLMLRDTRPVSVFAPP